MLANIIPFPCSYVYLFACPATFLLCFIFFGIQTRPKQRLIGSRFGFVSYMDSVVFKTLCRLWPDAVHPAGTKFFSVRFDQPFRRRSACKKNAVICFIKYPGCFFLLYRTILINDNLFKIAEFFCCRPPIAVCVFRFEIPCLLAQGIRIAAGCVCIFTVVSEAFDRE